MWRFIEVHSESTLWFSDGAGIDASRGGVGESSRLIVNHLGFLDITEIPSGSSTTAVDANGLRLGQPRSRRQGCCLEKYDLKEHVLSLEVHKNGSFTLSLHSFVAENWKQKQEFSGMYLHYGYYIAI